MGLASLTLAPPIVLVLLVSLLNEFSNCEQYAEAGTCRSVLIGHAYGILVFLALPGGKLVSALTPEAIAAKKVLRAAAKTKNTQLRLWGPFEAREIKRACLLTLRTLGLWPIMRGCKYAVHGAFGAGFKTKGSCLVAKGVFFWMLLSGLFADFLGTFPVGVDRKEADPGFALTPFAYVEVMLVVRLLWKARAERDRALVVFTLPLILRLAAVPDKVARCAFYTTKRFEYRNAIKGFDWSNCTGHEWVSYDTQSGLDPPECACSSGTAMVEKGRYYDSRWVNYDYQCCDEGTGCAFRDESAFSLLLLRCAALEISVLLMYGIALLAALFRQPFTLKMPITFVIHSLLTLVASMCGCSL